jgi:chromosome segregation ATPase
LAHDDEDLEQLKLRLDRLSLDKEQLGAELKAARQTARRLEAELSNVRQERERMMSERTQSPQGSMLPNEAASENPLRELAQLRTLYAEALSQKESAVQAAELLEKQMKELKAMIQELAEQGVMSSDTEAEALRAELEMAREQAGSELAALQARLNEAQAENARLFMELQSSKFQLSVREATVSEAGDSDAAPKRRPAAFKFLGPLGVGVILAALVLGGLFTLPAGRDLLRSWLASPVPVTSSPL